MGYEAEEKPVLHVNAGEFAALVGGVHHNTVGNWIKDGLPVSHRKGNAAVIDLWAAIPWLVARHRRELEAAKAANDPENDKGRKIAAEATLKEMEVAERQGTLVRAAEVEERWSQMMVAYREAAIGTAAVAVQDGLVALEQEPLLEKIVIDALTGAKLEEHEEEPSE